MIRANITQEESILQNLETWCYEVGSKFEKMGREAALDFIKYIISPYILELGAGDGSSSKTFVKNEKFVIAIDINYEKLKAIPSPIITWEADMLEALEILKDNSVSNVFAHHSLEHVVKAQEVINEISRVTKSKGFFYAIVPADDYLHSVHHVVFESAEELLPPGFKPIKMEKQLRNELEFICVAQKLVL